MFGMTKNPHVQHAHGFHQHFGIFVWVGIVDGRLTGPYLLPLRLTGHTYLIFLQEVISELLEVVSLDIRSRLWFQHDDASPHFSGEVHDHFNRCFGQRCIGLRGPIAWPPQSPDLTPLDFSVGPPEVCGVLDPCGHCGRSTCTSSRRCTRY